MAVIVVVCILGAGVGYYMGRLQEELKWRRNEHVPPTAVRYVLSSPEDPPRRQEFRAANRAWDDKADTLRSVQCSERLWGEPLSSSDFRGH